MQYFLTLKRAKYWNEENLTKVLVEDQRQLKDILWVLSAERYTIVKVERIDTTIEYGAEFLKDLKEVPDLETGKV